MLRIIIRLLSISSLYLTTGILASAHNEQCRVWMAPSTIAGAGLGLFAARSFQEEETLLDGDIVIPIVDLEANQFGNKYSFLWDDYAWGGANLGMDKEGTRHVAAASPGATASANSFLPVVNVITGAVQYSSLSMHRSMDPGAGAFSYYFNRTSFASRPIGAGEELFVDYGTKWFTGRENLGAIPLYKDLDSATSLYRAFRRLETSIDGIPGIADEIWRNFLQHNVFNSSRVLGGFNFSDPTERLKLASNMTLKQIRIEQSTRSIDWLVANGICADNISARRSTLKQAGRGAFAKRYLPRGTVIGLLPLLHIPRKRIFNMYKIGEIQGIAHPDPRLGLQGRQLLQNYCYGHRGSSLLLCPYSPMVNFINHNRTRVNAKLRWADPQKSNHNPDLLLASIDDIERMPQKARLAMEVIADKDIDRNEEIFLDYGEDWEAAWDAHLLKWSPVENTSRSGYISAESLNANASAGLRTVFELLVEPYPSNVDLKCSEEYLSPRWKHATQQGADAMNSFVATVPKFRRWFDCEILAYNESDSTYRAVLYQLEAKQYVPARNEIIEKIPSEGFKFVDKPYTTDMFLPSAFRHDIQIPDDMFPIQWKNLRS